MDKNPNIDIFALYEDLKKYIGDSYDDAFYDAAEGAAQFDIVKEMLEQIIGVIDK